jgi:hypothetical protein
MKAQGCGAASEIVKALKIGRASVYRVLEAKMIGASLGDLEKWIHWHNVLTVAAEAHYQVGVTLGRCRHFPNVWAEPPERTQIEPAIFENLAVGQLIELVPLGALFENCRSSRWLTGQHAGGEIECLTCCLERMQPMCHRPPALRIPPGDRAVMNPATRLAQCPGHAPRAGIFEGVPDGPRLPGCNRFDRLHHQYPLCDTLRHRSLPPSVTRPKSSPLIR